MASWTTPRTGFQTTVGLGEENTYGTSVSRSNWLQVLSTNIGRNVDRRPIPTLGKVGDTSRMTAAAYTASEACGVEFETVFSYDDSNLLLLKHAMGALATTGASSPYTHTFTLADRSDGLTLEHIEGNGSAEIVEGVALTGFSLSVTNGEFMRATWRGIGETSTAGQSAGTPTYSSNGNPVLFSQAGSVGFNSGTYSVLSFDLTVDNAQQERRQLASTQTLRPIGVGFRNCRVRIETEYLDDALYAAYLAGTESDLTATFTGTGDNELRITLQNARIVSHSRPVSGPGVIRETLEFEGQTDGTDLGLSIAIDNGNSSATAN